MKKNKRLMVLMGILMPVIGITFAYFTGKIIGSGEGAFTTVVTASIKNTELTIEGTLEFNYNNMLPGHKDISALKVSAVGNELIYYNLVWKGDNTLNTKINYTVYKVKEMQEGVSISCNKVWETVAGGKALSEKCTINNESKLGEVIGSGEIEANSLEQTVVLVNDERIQSKAKPGEIVYYYVVLEYPNLNEIQNEDIGKGFEGEVTVEEANKTPDINVMAVYVRDDDDYKEVSEIPQAGYYLNEQSSCSSGASLKWANGELRVTNLTKSGTSCYLYFDKLEVQTPEEVLADLGITDVKNAPASFAGTACAKGTGGNEAHSTGDCTFDENGVFKGEDDYGTTYYYRGTVNNNWVSFAGKTWRIIRINGNGTIRLIYAGEGEPISVANASIINTTSEGLSGYGYWTKNSTVGQLSEKSNYGESGEDNANVGFMYGAKGETFTGNDIPYNETHKNKNNSKIKTMLETWYNGNNGIKEEYRKYIDGATGFCNDRTPYQYDNISNSSLMDKSKYGFGTVNTYYGAYKRITLMKQPTFRCELKENDLFTMSNDQGNGNESLSLPVGLITADEVVFAGGANYGTNYSYWLWTNSGFWTMTPVLGGKVSECHIFYIINAGYLDYSSSIRGRGDGVRPVINLKSNTRFTGDGTIENPYMIKT